MERALLDYAFEFIYGRLQKEDGINGGIQLMEVDDILPVINYPQQILSNKLNYLKKEGGNNKGLWSPAMQRTSNPIQGFPFSSSIRPG